MKRILLFVVVLLGSIVAGAQENNIYILPFQPSIDGIPEEARSYLESKMENIIVNYGIASGGLSQHFVITSKVKVIERDIAPTTPIRISQKFEITMQIGDAVKNQVFSSCTMNVAGIGTTETKACIQAFQNINVNNPQFKELISVAKDRIIAYYNSNCDLLIQEAEQQIYRQQYDEAIAALIANAPRSDDSYSLSDSWSSSMS